MALFIEKKKNVSLAALIVVAILFLAVVSAASSSYVDARRRRMCHRIKKKGDGIKIRGCRGGGKYYRTCLVLLRNKPPNATDHMEKEALRRWYESFLPSNLTVYGKPRLLHCYKSYVNGFLAKLTRREQAVLASNPRVLTVSVTEVVLL